MTLLTSEEAGEVSDAFLKTLYGDDIYNEWKALKLELNFAKEKDFVRWLIDVANVYKQDDDDDYTKDCSGDGGNMSGEVDVGAVKCEVKDEGTEDASGVEMECVKATESCYDDTPLRTDDSGGAVRGSEWGQVFTDTAGHEVGVSEEGVSRWPDIMSTPVTQAVAGESNDHMFATAGPHDDVSAGAVCGPGQQQQQGVSRSRGSRAARYTCVECLTFSTNKLWHLKQHVSRVHQHVQSKFSCNYCDYSCADGYSLRRHVSGVHQKLTPHLCSLCDRGFAQKYNLLRHLKSRHDQHVM